MKMLMLSPTLPWPLNMGSKLRIFHVLRELSRHGHEVTLLTIAHESYKNEDLEILKRYCNQLQVIPIDKCSRFKAVLKSLLSNKPYRLAKLESAGFEKEAARALERNYDILWVHFMETLAYLPPQKFKSNQLLVLLDQHNADELYWKKFVHKGSFLIRGAACLNLWKLRRFQRVALTKVNLVLSVSGEDAEFTRSRLKNPSTKVWVIPNGVDSESFRPARDEKRKNRIIFCGSMDVLMNIEAVEWFAHDLFPKIRKSIPSAEFWVVGKNPDPRVKALAALPGVKITGRVEDVRPYYAKAKVAVAPFCYGGGTKIKVLEAMALGVPVVATPIGCLGIEAIPDRHLFVEVTDESFSQRVVDLLQDDKLWNQIVIEARRLVEECYSWHGIMNNTILRIESLVERQMKR